MSGWQRLVGSDRPEAYTAFASLESVWQLRGEPVTFSSLCTVERVVLDGRGYYVKRYRHRGEGIAKFVGRSKARTEWQNLLRFRDWGLPAAELVAFGEETRWRLPGRGVVITAEVENSTDLASLAKQNSPLLQNPHWVRQVMEQVAAASAVMHRHKFAHNDWKWRNILVSGSDSEPQVHMIDCPAGTFWWGPFFEYRRIKDIACLDKVAKQMLSCEQRLDFYRLYRGVAVLDKRDHRDLGKIQRFFRGRE